MGSNSYFNWKAAPCPGCGKEDAARMGSSAWGHELSCCSEACGLRVRDALVDLRKSGEYRFFLQMAEHARMQLAALQTEQIKWLRSNKEWERMREDVSKVVKP